MKKLIVLLLSALALIAAPVSAQTPPVGYVQVSDSNLQDSNGVKVANATISFAPVNNSGTPISYQVNGNGQATTRAVTALVTSGVFTIQLADTALTNPDHVCFNVTTKDNTSGKSLLGPGYTCVQPAGSGTAVTGGNAWCTAASSTAGGSCNFDSYVPNEAALVVTQTGPTGPAGPACSTGSGVCNMTVPISAPKFSGGILIGGNLTTIPSASAFILGLSKGSITSNVLYSNGPYPNFASNESDAGGRDSELEETNNLLDVEQLVAHTGGLTYSHYTTQYCYSPGDCIPFMSETYGGGVVASQNEGLDWHIRLQEVGYVFQGTVNSFSCTSSPDVCTWNTTQTQGNGQLPFGVSGNVGIQLAEGLQLIDITQGYNTGTISNIPNAGGSGCCGATITGSGVNWDSTFGDTLAQAVSTAAINNGGGPNTFPKINVTIPTGTWTGTFTVSATPVCIFDEVDTRYQCAEITAVTPNVSITVDRLQWPVTTGAALDQGGLTGYCFGMDLDMVTSSSQGGYGNPTDSQVINPIRRCQPIQYNTSGNTLTLYTNSSGETQFTTRANPAVSGSGAYHIYPAAMTETVLNASTGNVDGGGVTTTPPVGTFNTGDTVEQPHYYAQKGGGINWASNSWASMPDWGGSFSFSMGGTQAWGNFQGALYNSNSPYAYWGLPTALSQASTPGMGTASTPHAYNAFGPYASILYSDTPSFGQYRSKGTVYQGCGTTSAFCDAWNQSMWLVTTQNTNNYPYGEDDFSYNPTNFTWYLSAGGNGPNGANATCVQNWGPNGWSQTGTNCSEVGSGMPLLATAPFSNLAGGVTAQVGGSSITDNTFDQGFTLLNDGGYSWGTFPGRDSSGNMWTYFIMNSGGGGGWAFCEYNTSGGAVTVTTPSQMENCHQLAAYGSGVTDTIVTELKNTLTSITGGSGVTVSCYSGNCTNISGTIAVTPGTFTTGVLVTLVWPATPTAYKCTVSQNGGAAFYGIGHSVATGTGMAITNTVSVSGAASFSVDYICSAN